MILRKQLVGAVFHGERQIKSIPLTCKKLQIKQKTVTEEIDVNQGKLVIGFRTNINAQDKCIFHCWYTAVF